MSEGAGRADRATPDSDVVLVGAGAIGIRHLEALTRLEGAADRLVVVEPRHDAQQAAAARAEELGVEQLRTEPSVAHAAGHLRNRPVVVVATAADVRAAVTLEVLAHLQPVAIVLEKILFQRPLDYDRMGEAFASHDVPVWVNHPRAYAPGWDAVRPRLRPLARWDAEVHGRGWGLACNSVHFLEPLLPGDESVAFDVSGLRPGSIPAKRPGFVEVTGTLVASTPSRRVVLRDDGGSPSSVEIDLSWPGGGLVVVERGESMDVREAGVTTTYPVPFQSQLTHLVVEDLERTSSCRLPGYVDVAGLHRGLVEAVSLHLVGTGESHWGDRCPIT